MRTLVGQRKNGSDLIVEVGRREVEDFVGKYEREFSFRLGYFWHLQYQSQFHVQLLIYVLNCCRVVFWCFYNVIE